MGSTPLAAQAMVSGVHDPATARVLLAVCRELAELKAQVNQPPPTAPPRATQPQYATEQALQNVAKGLAAVRTMLDNIDNADRTVATLDQTRIGLKLTVKAQVPYWAKVTAGPTSGTYTADIYRARTDATAWQTAQTLTVYNLPSDVTLPANTWVLAWAQGDGYVAAAPGLVAARYDETSHKFQVAGPDGAWHDVFTAEACS